MAYTTINKPSDHFNIVTYDGDGTSPRSITGVGFQPDFLWLKNYSGSNTYEPRWMDAVRGSNKVLHPTLTAVENTEEYYTVGSFDSDGWTGRNGTGSNQIITGGNDSSHSFVGWAWKGDGTSGTENTDGDITSTVNANTAAGFSIVGYTGNGTANQTVGHGLNSTPEIIIIKNRDEGTAYWSVINPRTADTSNTNIVYLNNDAVEADDTNIMGTNLPNATTFGVDDYTGVNTVSSKFIAYCWHSVRGYSKMGTYKGNANSNGAFIYTGFKPRFVMIRRMDAAENWHVFDSQRNPIQPTNGTYDGRATRLFPNRNDNNDLSQSGPNFFSNGFKFTSTWSGGNGANFFIYMAFADKPFIGSNGTVGTAE